MSGKGGLGMLCPEQLLGPTSPFSSLCATSLGESSVLGLCLLLLSSSPWGHWVPETDTQIHKQQLL